MCHSDESDSRVVGGSDSAMIQPVAANKQSFFLAVALAAIDVSLVDHTPEEILLLTASGLSLDFADGIGPENSFTSVRVSIASIEVDDQVAQSRFPVLITSAAVDNEEGGLAQPLLQASLICQPGGAQGQVSSGFSRLKKPHRATLLAGIHAYSTEVSKSLHVLGQGQLLHSSFDNRSGCICQWPANDLLGA